MATEETVENTLRDDLERAIADVEAEFGGDDHEREATQAGQAGEASDDTSTVDGERATVDATGGSDTDQAGGASTGDRTGGDGDGEGARAEKPRDPETGRFIADETYPDDAEKYPGLTAERVNAPPAGWRPAAREGWSELPEGVRREIHRRELDIAVGQQESADARRFSESFHGLVEPYMPLIRAHGTNNPLEAVQGLLNTAAVLQTGTPAQKAARIVQLITNYGVGVEDLDRALASSITGDGGGAPPAGNGSGNGSDGGDLDPAVAAYIDSRLKPLDDRLAAGQEQLQAQSKQDVETFAEGKEFLADVRLDMADLLDAATARGRRMSLQEAYDAACYANPEIRAILDKRAAESRTTEQTGVAERKAALAASSLSGPRSADRVPGSLPASNGTLRGDIEAAIAVYEEAE